jgi:hypothetical protein
LIARPIFKAGIWVVKAAADRRKLLAEAGQVDGLAIAS